MLGQKLTSKYQTTIPKEIREFLGLEAGDRVMFVKKGDEVVIVGVNATLADLRGVVKSPRGKRKTSDEIREIVKSRVAERIARGDD